MKQLGFVFLLALVSTHDLQAQQPLELCKDGVAAVIRDIRSPCAFRENKNTKKVDQLNTPADIHRRLSAGQQLQCNKKGCVIIYLCGSLQDKPVERTPPKWFTVVNVPQRLPSGETRPGRHAYFVPSGLLSSPTVTVASVTPNLGPAVAANVFRPKNPETDLDRHAAALPERPAGLWQAPQTIARAADRKPQASEPAGSGAPAPTAAAVPSGITPQVEEKLPPSNEKVATTNDKKRLLFGGKVARLIGSSPALPHQYMIEQALAAGNEARDTGMFTDAEKEYRKVLAQKPTEWRAVLGLANTYSDQQRWQDAEAAYRQALESNPLLPGAYSSLSFVLLQPAHEEISSFRLVAAEKAAREAIRLQPTNALAHDLLGVALEMQGGSPKQAEEAYRRAVQLQSNFVVAHLHLAHLLRTMGRNTEAKSHYLRVLTLNIDAGILLKMSEQMQSEGQFRDSEIPLRQLLKIEPNNPSALYLLSKALVYRKKYGEAVRLIQSVVGKDEVKFQAQRLLAFTFLRMKRLKDAEQALSVAAAMASPDQRKLLTDMSGLAGVAEQYLSKDRPQDAVRVYEDALVLDSENAQIKSKLALARGLIKQP